MSIIIFIAILSALVVLISFFPFTAPVLVWIIGTVIFLIMLAVAYFFILALVPIIAIGFLIWIIYSAFKGWKKR